VLEMFRRTLPDGAPRTRKSGRDWPVKRVIQEQPGRALVRRWRLHFDTGCRNTPTGVAVPRRVRIRT